MSPWLPHFSEKTVEAENFHKGQIIMKKKPGGPLGKPLPFRGLSLPLAVMGWSRGGTVLQKHSALAQVAYASRVEWRKTVAPLVRWGHAPDVTEPAMWTQVATLPTDRDFG